VTKKYGVGNTDEPERSGPEKFEAAYDSLGVDVADIGTGECGKHPEPGEDPKSETV